jgi:hypothetical protein
MVKVDLSHTKDVSKSGCKIRDDKQEVVERHRTLLVEIGSILVDGREVRKKRFSQLCRCAGCAF